VNPGGTWESYAASVYVNTGVQSDFLALVINDAIGSQIITGNFAWTPDGSGKLVSQPQGMYVAGRVQSDFGVRQQDVADNIVPLLAGGYAQGNVYLPYLFNQLAIASGDAYVGQQFSASVSPILSPPVYPLAYVWHLDGVEVGHDQTYQTFFNDTNGHLLDVTVTDATGKSEATSRTVYPLNPGGCDMPPCNPQ
jgi:hypothetical protein